MSKQKYGMHNINKSRPYKLNLHFHSVMNTLFVFIQTSSFAVKQRNFGMNFFVINKQILTSHRVQNLSFTWPVRIIKKLPLLNKNIILPNIISLKMVAQVQYALINSSKETAMVKKVIKKVPNTSFPKMAWHQIL